jgi:hypothetical protein
MKSSPRRLPQTFPEWIGGRAPIRVDSFSHLRGSLISFRAKHLLTLQHLSRRLLATQASESTIGPASGALAQASSGAAGKSRE